MNIRSYCPGDAYAVLEMLDKHIDFTPEKESPQNNMDNIEYFKEVYVDEKGCGINYVLTSDDGAKMLGFMEITERRLPNSSPCWYITALFTAHDNDEEMHAIALANAFAYTIRGASEICANVHPSDTPVSEFWTRNGFTPNPGRSSFMNADDQLLVAYCKQLPSLSS